MPTNRSLNVGLVFDDSLDRPDGVAQYVKNVGAWLTAQGHSVSYLVGETKAREWAGGKVYSLSKNVTVSFNGNRLSMPLPGNKKAIKRLFVEHNFDVLHVMVPYSPFMAAKVIKQAPTKTAVVGTFHIFPSGPLSKIGSRLLRLLLLRSIGRFQQIVSVSQPAADFAHSHYRLTTHVVPNPVETAIFNSTGAKEHPGEIVFLGRLVKRKGADKLIEAFSLLRKMNSDATLVIAGDGAERPRLEMMVKKLGLSDKIKFLGFVPEADKPSLLARASVACFPSLYGEAFGIVLIEAMAAGAMTVLAGDNPGYRSVLGGRPELLIAPNDKQEFAARLNEFLTDKNKRDQIHEWQKSEIKKYDIAIVGGQLMQMYDSAIARLKKNRHNNRYE